MPDELTELARWVDLPDKGEQKAEGGLAMMPVGCSATIAFAFLVLREQGRESPVSGVSKWVEKVLQCAYLVQDLKLENLKHVISSKPRNSGCV